jgi:hypothetical protein
MAQSGLKGFGDGQDILRNHAQVQRQEPPSAAYPASITFTRNNRAQPSTSASMVVASA